MGDTEIQKLVETCLELCDNYTNSDYIIRKKNDKRARFIVDDIHLRDEKKISASDYFDLGNGMLKTCNKAIKSHNSIDPKVLELYEKTIETVKKANKIEPNDENWELLAHANKELGYYLMRDIPKNERKIGRCFFESIVCYEEISGYENNLGILQEAGNLKGTFAEFLYESEIGVVKGIESMFKSSVKDIEDAISISDSFDNHYDLAEIIRSYLNFSVNREEYDVMAITSLTEKIIHHLEICQWKTEEYDKAEEIDKDEILEVLFLLSETYMFKGIQCITENAMSDLENAYALAKEYYNEADKFYTKKYDLMARAEESLAYGTLDPDSKIRLYGSSIKNRTLVVSRDPSPEARINLSNVMFSYLETIIKENKKSLEENLGTAEETINCFKKCVDYENNANDLYSVGAGIVQIIDMFTDHVEIYGVKEKLSEWYNEALNLLKSSSDKLQSHLTDHYIAYSHFGLAEMGYNVCENLEKSIEFSSRSIDNYSGGGEYTLSCTIKEVTYTVDMMFPIDYYRLRSNSYYSLSMEEENFKKRRELIGKSVRDIELVAYLTNSATNFFNLGLNYKEYAEHQTFTDLVERFKLEALKAFKISYNIDPDSETKEEINNLELGLF